MTLALQQRHPGVVLVFVLVLLAGVGAVAYGRWARPFVEAADAVTAGQPDTALAAYAAAESRFLRVPLTRRLFVREYASAVYNQLALLYQAGRYDAVLEKAGTAPADAAPQYWAGMALFAIGMQEEIAETRLAWLARAEDAFKQALEATPDDWDTKYNYEVAARLAAALRKQPKLQPDTLMRLLRPEPKAAPPVRKVG
jgi:tetratricopeptide (TPR) repeat protein